MSKNSESTTQQPGLSRKATATEDLEIYRHLVSEIRDYAIFMLDPEGFIMTWNAGAERLKGYSREEIIGEHFSRFYQQIDISNDKPRLELETALAEGRLEDEGWRLRKDGSRFWANVIITTIYGKGGEHIGFAKVTRDLSERRAAEQALRMERADLEKRVEERTSALTKANLALAEANTDLARANEELERAGRMKDQFLAVLSHELRTPLTSIYGWLSMLQSGKVAEAKVVKALQIIERNVKAQAQLVDDLLNVSRIVSGKLKIAPQWVDPLSVIRAAVESIGPAALAKDIDVILKAHDSESIFVDPDRIQQVIWNLLTNAVKFTGNGGQVKVDLRRAGSQLEIDVTDTGQGIEPEFLPHVFDRFSQGDASTTRKIGGLGLGLSIVRHIVEMHGGSANVYSEGIGHGTKVSIQIPVPTVQPGSVFASSSVIPTTLDGLKVMVVEDEADTREMLVEALQSYGASVIMAASAAEALEQIVQGAPDLLVSDIGLPNIDGYQLLSKIRSDLPLNLRNIPAVALSAFAGIEHTEKSRQAGFQAHVAKPIAVPELVSTLVKVVRNR